MNRRHWRIAAGFVICAGITALALLLGLGVFGPKPGAPEGERSLGLGPIWLSRMDVSEPAEGVRLHKTVTNWPMIVVAISIAGAIGALVAGAPRAAAPRRLDSPEAHP
jgi:hypothetical protein